MEETVVSFPGIMNDFVEGCTLLEKSRVPDGEGGWITRWFDGPTFFAAITHDGSMRARVAESEGMSSTYTVTTERGNILDFHDVFRRDSDGQTFRVTSDGTDEMTPRSASFQVSQVAAEEWVLT